MKQFRTSLCSLQVLHCLIFKSILRSLGSIKTSRHLKSQKSFFPPSLEPRYLEVDRLRWLLLFGLSRAHQAVRAHHAAAAQPPP